MINSYQNNFGKDFIFKDKLNVHNQNPKNNNSINKLCNSGSKSTRFLKSNNSAINLLNSNIFSINNPQFDNLKKIHKSQSTIFDVNKQENNYLDIIGIYSYRTNEIKENQKKNNINSPHLFTLFKHKIFNLDSDSKIKKGNNISRKEFYEEKKKILSLKHVLKNKKDYNTNTNNNIDINHIDSYTNEKKDERKEGYDYKFNVRLSMDNIFNCKRYKKDSEGLNKKLINIRDYINSTKNHIDYWRKLRKENNKSVNSSFDNESSKKLKNNIFLFKQDYKNLARQKNWWKKEE